MLYKLFEHLYAPFLLKKWVRAAVIVVFFGWACSSIAVVPKIEIGEKKIIDKYMWIYQFYIKVFVTIPKWVKL